MQSIKISFLLALRVCSLVWGKERIHFLAAAAAAHRTENQRFLMARCFRLKKNTLLVVSLTIIMFLHLLFPVSRLPQARVQQGAQGELPADTHLQLQEGGECICGFIFFFFSWQLCLVCTYIRFLLFPLANGQINKQHNELYVLPETRMSI